MTVATVAALAELVGGRLVGDGSRSIVGLGDLRSAGPNQIGFVRHARYRAAAQSSRAGALLLVAALDTDASQILVDDVDLAYAKVALHFHPVPRAHVHRVHPAAVVDAEADLEPPVEIGANAVIGRCRIGAGSVVMSGAVLMDGTTLGRNCVIYPNATIYANVRLGERVIVHASAVIGSDGFGYAHGTSGWIKVPQLGTVELADDVEIGAGTAIDRGTLGSTRIGPRTKIDNLCHIAHNCVIGSEVAMAAGGMIAGSTTIGDRCVFAGQVGIAGHLNVAADVRLGGATVVLRDIPNGGDYMGHPVIEKRRFFRLLRVLRGLVSGRGEPPE
jgi:UDP-3-O-[3-hydroxymyristoyl] glucosamine N-acyltransferase